ncbi:MAG TPA: hypothetical protein VIV11_02290 [Kofleriaceae bacterium]
MRASTLGIVLLTAIAVGMACGGPRFVPDDPRPNEILLRWGEIRQWRVDAGLAVDPAPSTMMQMTKQTVKQAESVCPEGHVVPKTCHDVCNLSDAICDNAERICEIAADLNTTWAHDKCTSAKASCREAKQRCCKCSETDSKASIKW